MKKNKGVWILAGLVIVLITVYFVLISSPTKEDVSETDYSLTDIYNIDSNSVKSMKFTSDDETYTLDFSKEDVVISELEGATVDSEKAKDTMYSLSYITTPEIVDDNPKNLDDFGLENPSYTLEIKSDKEDYTIIVGDPSPGKDGYYCKTTSENKVFLISERTYELISKPSSYYRTASFFEVTRDSISSVTMDIYGKHTISFEENIVSDTNTPHNVFNKYQMTSPYNWPVSGDMIGQILDSFTNIEVIEYAAEDLSKMSAFGFAPYTAKLQFVHDGGVADTIYFGDNKEGIIYIHVNDDSRIYGINYEPFSYIELDPFSYLSNFAFLRNIMTVKKIEYQNEDIKAEFELKPVDEENVDVKKDGKLISQEKFKELYTELISISVSGDCEIPPSEDAFLTYVFEYNDGSSECVEFVKIDDRRAALLVNDECQFYVNVVELNQKLDKINSLINNF